MFRSRTFHATALTVAALGGGIALAACGSSGSTAATTPAPAASSPAAATTGTATTGTTTTGTNVTATETEFKIALSQQKLSPGTYTFTAKNAGSVTHALTINGPGVSDMSTGDISPGATKTLTVTLKAGTYDVFCPVADHKMLGMDDTVTVA